MAEKQNVTRMEQGARFRELLKEIRLTQVEVAAMVGTKQSSISHAISGKIGIPPAWLLVLRRHDSRINTDWIMSGVGQMLGTTVSVVREPVPMYPERLGTLKSFDEVDLERVVLRLVARLDELERRVAVLEGGGTKGD